MLVTLSKNVSVVVLILSANHVILYVALVLAIRGVDDIGFVQDLGVFGLCKLRVNKGCRSGRKWAYLGVDAVSFDLSSVRL